MMHHPKFRSAVQSVMYGPRPSPDAPYAAYSPGWDSLRQGFGLQAGRSIPDAIEGHRYLAPAGDFASSLGTDPLRSIIYGAAVARFLLHMGIGGTALLGIVGGAVGSQFGGSPRNAYGQRVNTEYDPFGHRHLVF